MNGMHSKNNNANPKTNQLEILSAFPNSPPNSHYKNHLHPNSFKSHPAKLYPNVSEKQSSTNQPKISKLNPSPQRIYINQKPDNYYKKYNLIQITIHSILFF